MNENRIFFHIDLDAFFASCEERENPHFRGKPIVVGADPKEGKGRGVVSTANYIARKFGIHSAMPISQAWRLCPVAIFLPVNGALYSRVSNSVMDILQGFAKTHNAKFEQVSIDEAYLEFCHLTHLGKRIAKNIKTKIHNQEKITASVGVGPNMLIAKIGSDFQKPDGLTIVSPEDVQAFLDPLPVKKIPGVGPKTEIELHKLEVKTVFELRKLPQSLLYETFGQHGISLYESARGIDNRSIGAEDTTNKSISEEHTFEHDTNSAQEMLPVFFLLVQNVLRTATAEGYPNFRAITIKVRYSDFKTHTKTQSRTYATKDFDRIEKIALQLLWPFLGKQKIRLIGFRVSRFT